MASRQERQAVVTPANKKLTRSLVLANKTARTALDTTYAIEELCGLVDALTDEVEILRKENKKFLEAGNAMDNAISELDPQRLERSRYGRMTDAEYVAVIKWRTAKDPDYNRA